MLAEDVRNWIHEEGVSQAQDMLCSKLSDQEDTESHDRRNEARSQVGGTERSRQEVVAQRAWKADRRRVSGHLSVAERVHPQGESAQVGSYQQFQTVGAPRPDISLVGNGRSRAWQLGRTRLSLKCREGWRFRVDNFV